MAGPEEAQRIGHAYDRNHREYHPKFPVPPHGPCGNPLCKGQVGDHVRQQDCRDAEGRGLGEMGHKHQQKHSRGSKGMQEHHQQPFPCVCAINC